MQQPSTVKEVNELDQMLSQYKQHPTSIQFDQFGKYYDFLKDNKLLKPLTQEQINSLQQAYNNNKFKCRCACVQITFNGYTDTGFTFAKVFEMREKLNTKGK